MSVTEASHTQIPSRGMRAWTKKTSLWQWRTATCDGKLWIRSRLPGPPDDDDDYLNCCILDKVLCLRSVLLSFACFGCPTRLSVLA